MKRGQVRVAGRRRFAFNILTIGILVFLGFVICEFSHDPLSIEDIHYLQQPHRLVAGFIVNNSLRKATIEEVWVVAYKTPSDMTLEFSHFPPAFSTPITLQPGESTPFLAPLYTTPGGEHLQIEVLYPTVLRSKVFNFQRRVFKKFPSLQRQLPFYCRPWSSVKSAPLRPPSADS